MLLLNNFDLDADFWTSNPELKVMFRSFYDAEVPSSHMWAVALYTHPKSKLFNESPATRRQIIAKDYLQDENFDFSQLEPLIAEFKKSLLTKAERLLSNWEMKLHERDELISSIPYSAETFEMLDKMIDKTPKMWQQYNAILEALEKENATRTEGNLEESLTEKGLI